MSHHRTARHSGPLLSARGREHAVGVQRIGRHGELAVGVVPLRPRAVGVDLDAESVGIAQIERLADQMIRRSGAHADAGHMSQEAAERGAVGEQNGEMIEAEPALNANGRRVRVGVEHDEGRVLSVRMQRRGGRRDVARLQPEHLRVVVERATEVAHAKANWAKPQLIREQSLAFGSRGRRRTIDSLGHAQVIGRSPHRAVRTAPSHK